MSQIDHAASDCQLYCLRLHSYCLPWPPCRRAACWTTRWPGRLPAEDASAVRDCPLAQRCGVHGHWWAAAGL